MRLNRSKFLAWLKMKKPNEVVGEARANCGCPLARFYKEASGGWEVSIFDNGEGYMIDRGYNRLPLPAWAERFTISIDDELPVDHNIEAWRAIQLLEAA